MIYLSILYYDLYFFPSTLLMCMYVYYPMDLADNRLL